MRFPFVRTDRPDHSRRDLYFLFNQHYPARSVKLYIAGTKEMVFSKKKKNSYKKSISSSK